jgi:hypothetical protein
MQFQNIVQYASKIYQHKERSQACPHCGAIRINGEWEWPYLVPAGAIEEPCPACNVTRENRAVAKLVVQGEASREQHNDVISIARFNADVFMQQFPLSRIMCIESDENSATIISFTCRHLNEFIAKTVNIIYGKQVVVEYVSDGDVIIINFIKKMQDSTGCQK